MKLAHTSLTALVMGLSLASASAFAEPPVQAGETLESLSKAKVVTTVNGQPGTLQEVLANAQMKVISEGATTQAPSDAKAPIGNLPPAEAEVTAPQAQTAVPAQPEVNATEEAPVEAPAAE